MRGSRQITDNMKHKIIELYFRDKSIKFLDIDIRNNLYDEVQEFTIEVGGNIWNYHSTLQNEDEAILFKEYLNKSGKGHFRNFKISEIPVEVYTIWERI